MSLHSVTITEGESKLCKQAALAAQGGRSWFSDPRRPAQLPASRLCCRPACASGRKRAWRALAVCAEVLLTCMTHALTTEGEEIMGLLLGDITVRRHGSISSRATHLLPAPASACTLPHHQLQEPTPGQTVSNIWIAYPQIRTDRRKVQTGGRCRHRGAHLQQGVVHHTAVPTSRTRMRTGPGGDERGPDDAVHRARRAPDPRDGPAHARGGLVPLAPAHHRAALARGRQDAGAAAARAWWPPRPPCSPGEEGQLKGGGAFPLWWRCTNRAGRLPDHGPGLRGAHLQRV